MTQQRPSCLLTMALVLLVSIGLGACIVLLNPGRDRPADLTPTPYVPTVVVGPTRPVPPTVAPPPTMPTPERLLLTPVIVPAPTRTPTVEPTPTETPTPKPERTAVQRG
jgi:hypothetical protein